MFSKKTVVISYLYLISILLYYLFFLFLPDYKELFGIVYFIETIFVIVICWKDFIKLSSIIKKKK